MYAGHGPYDLTPMHVASAARSPPPQRARRPPLSGSIRPHETNQHLLLGGVCINGSHYTISSDGVNAGRPCGACGCGEAAMVRRGGFHGPISHGRGISSIVLLLASRESRCSSHRSPWRVVFFSSIPYPPFRFRFTRPAQPVSPFWNGRSRRDRNRLTAFWSCVKSLLICPVAGTSYGDGFLETSFRASARSR